MTTTAMRYNSCFLSLLAWPVLLFIVSPGCTKNNSSSNPAGCIVRNVWKASDIVMPPADYDLAVMLFNNNQISLKDNQPIQVYTSGTDSSGALLQDVFVRQYFNYLPVCEASNEFIFDQGKFLNVPYQLSGLLQTTDTSASIEMDSLRKIFLDSKPDSYPPNGMSQKKSPHWEDSCLVAVQSYVYKTALEPDVNSGDSLIKVWAIYGQGNLNAIVSLISDPGAKAFPIHSTYNWP